MLQGLLVEEQTKPAGMRAYRESSIGLGRVSSALKFNWVPSIALSTNDILHEWHSQWRWIHSVIALCGSSTQNWFASLSCTSGAHLSLLPITISHFQGQINAGRLKSVANCVCWKLWDISPFKTKEKKDDPWPKPPLIRNNSCCYGSRIWFLSFFSHKMQWIVSALTLSSHTSKT